MFLVHLLKDLSKIVDFAFWRRDRPAGLSHTKRGGPPEYLFGLDGLVIRVLKRVVGALMEKFRNQYKCKSPLTLRSHMTAGFGDPYQGLAASEPNRMIYSHIWIEFN